jgi:hypothetical protein
MTFLENNNGRSVAFIVTRGCRHLGMTLPLPPGTVSMIDYSVLMP